MPDNLWTHQTVFSAQSRRQEKKVKHKDKNETDLLGKSREVKADGQTDRQRQRERKRRILTVFPIKWRTSATKIDLSANMSARAKSFFADEEGENSRDIDRPLLPCCIE